MQKSKLTSIHEPNSYNGNLRQKFFFLPKNCLSKGFEFNWPLKQRNFWMFCLLLNVQLIFQKYFSSNFCKILFVAHFISKWKATKRLFPICHFVLFPKLYPFSVYQTTFCVRRICCWTPRAIIHQIVLAHNRLRRCQSGGELENTDVEGPKYFISDRRKYFVANEEN